MKKVLTIAVVALLATATLFAGVSFSGRFRQGYKFTFADGADPAVSAWKSEEAKVVVKISDDNGIWTVNLKNVGALDSNDKWAANATFDLTKALKGAGVDTGDFGLKISLGNNSKLTALSAYNDVTGNEYYKLKNNGSESIQLAMNYGKIVSFNVGVDPTNGTTTSITSKFDDATNTYVYTKKTTDKKASLVVSAKASPVDGVSVSGAYAYKGWFQDATNGNPEVTADHMVGAAVDVNVQKLADLDFKLGVSAYDNIALGDTTKNSFAANVYGGVDKVDGFVEFAMLNVKDADSVFALNTQVNLNLVEGLGLDVYFNITDLANTGDTFVVGGDVSYKLAGAQFALNAEYAQAKKAFSVTPKMIIVF